MAPFVLLAWYVGLNLLNMMALTWIPPPEQPPPPPPPEEPEYILKDPSRIKSSAISAADVSAASTPPPDKSYNTSAAGPVAEATTEGNALDAVIQIGNESQANAPQDTVVSLPV